SAGLLALDGADEGFEAADDSGGAVFEEAVDGGGRGRLGAPQADDDGYFGAALAQGAALALGINGGHGWDGRDDEDGRVARGYLFVKLLRGQLAGHRERGDVVVGQDAAGHGGGDMVGDVVGG